MKQVARMLLDPVTKLVVIISSHTEDEKVNPLYSLFDFLGILIDNLPSKSKGYENRNHCDTRENQGDV